MLRNRNFVLLWLAQCVSAAGDTFSFLAIAIRIDNIYADPGSSARALSLVLIAYALPVLIIGIFAGTLVDRWDRKWVMIGSDLARAALAPAFLFLKTSADLPLAVGAAFLLAATSVFFYPARTALLPVIVEKDQLMTANGWMQVGNTIARLSGPILAGIVVARWGTNIAFWVDAASYLISAAFVIGIVGVTTRIVAGMDQKRSAWKDLAEGIRFALSSRLIKGITFGIAVGMLGLGALNVLFVPFLRHIFGVSAEALGGIQAAQGAGMLIGGLILGSLGRKLSPLSVAIAGMILLGLGVGLFGLAPVYSVALIAAPIIGFSIAPINASLQTLLQRGVPQEMLGRAGSVMDMSISLANIVSMGLAGLLGAAIGLRQVFLGGGVLIILGGLIMGGLLRGEESEIRKEEGSDRMSVIKDVKVPA